MSRRARLLLGAAALAVMLGAGGATLARQDDDRATPASATRAGNNATAGADDNTEHVGGTGGQSPSGEQVDPNEAQSPPVTAVGAPVDLHRLPAVGVGEPAEFGTGLVVTVTAIEPIDVQARGPGETAGAAVVVHLKLHNKASEAIDLGGIAVNAATADGTPAIPNFAPPAGAVAGVLEPGEARSGTYVFRTDAGIDGMTVDVHHNRSPHIVMIQI
jgi:hypothetical protein